MYSFQINPWHKDTVAKHYETKWEISTSEDFSVPGNIIETAITSETNGSLNSYTTNIQIPAGATYYIRATRMFLNLSAANHSLTPVPIRTSNMDSVMNNNIVLSDSVKIEKPFVYVSVSEYNDSRIDYFTVKTSSFRCKQDGHLATHWIITTKDGEVLFTSLSDTVNKTEIRIDKVTDILNKATFIIRAIHVGTNGIESDAGEYVFQNLNFNFEIKGLTTDIPPHTNLNLYIVPSTARASLVSKVYLRVPNDDNQITKGIDITPASSSSTIVVPGSELNYDSKYYLDVYGYDTSGEYNSRRITLYTQRSNFNNTVYPVNFEKQIQIYPDNTYGSLRLPRAFTTYQLPSGKVLLPSNQSGVTTIYEYGISYTSSASGGSVSLNFGSQGTRFDIRLPSTSVDGNNVFIKIYNNNILIMDCGDIDSGSSNATKPRFFKYIYDPISQSLTASGSSDQAARRNEMKSVGGTAAITQVSQTHLWYIPSVASDSEKCIKSLNLETMAITTEMNLDKTSLGDNAIEQATSFSIIYNRAKGRMIILTNAGKEVIIDPITKRVLDIRDVEFAEWLVDAELKAVELPNGDYLVTNIKTIKADNSVVYYDCETDEYTPIPFSPTGNSYDFYGSVCPIAANSFFACRRTDVAGGQTQYTVSRVY